MAESEGATATGSGPIARSKMSAVECAGSVDTSSTRRPRRLAASAVADAHVVLPTPPLPPKNSTCRSKRSRTRGLAAGQRADGRAIHAHATVPEMELIEEIRVDVEQVQRRRIGQPDDLHVAEQQEQIVQL